ncbi:hypothetical protein [Nostoc sp. CHAB 5715]|nr:hypothetical protein [Nostoc sp. CHAB 5715]MCC5621494.1 hypothetical protein [Nostoc sp. CHAB 5715]
MMFVTAQQLEQQMPDATRLLSDESEMETWLHWNKNSCFGNGWRNICDR